MASIYELDFFVTFEFQLNSKGHAPLKDSKGQPREKIDGHGEDGVVGPNFDQNVTGNAQEVEVAICLAEFLKSFSTNI